MNIPENAETNTLTIQGITFSVPVVVSPADLNESLSPVCAPEMAAQILQQTFQENWRNNFAKQVTDAISAVAKANDIEFKKVADLSDEDAQTINDKISVEDLQTALDAYIAAYTPGVRRASGGVALSPLERETNKLAVEMVRDYLESQFGVGRTARSETYKAWDARVQEEQGMTGAEHIAEMAAQLTEANPSIRETAQANIDARANLSANIELNFGE